ncbi:hypothetical protein Tco_0874486 [Tanacetum coccineum]|uniref:Retrotransposon gag domain-containing protein n=1 Tax=Tanacetum coccineum TaxID=301880 RepID=A0ABQ5BLQ5_9ASTR
MFLWILITPWEDRSLSWVDMVRVDDRRMYKKLGSYDTAHDGFSGEKLQLVAVCYWCLDKGGPWSEVPACYMKLLSIGNGEQEFLWHSWKIQSVMRVKQTAAKNNNFSASRCSISINRDLIQAIPTSLPLQPIEEATKASNLQRIPPESKGDHTLLTFYMEDDVDIRALTIKQYIALIPDDIRPGIVNPKIGDDFEFEINANFIRELRRKLFACTDDEHAYEHVHTVLEIVDLFHFPGVTHDAIMLRVFPITLKGRALRWKDRLPAGYNDLLYQCPLHDLNCQQKVHIFYTGLDIPTRKILDSNGFIPLMTPTEALESIQVMADHSHNWYDETTTKERINDVLDNVDAIHKREKVKAIMTMGMENMKESVPHDLPPTRFLGHLKEQIGSPYRTRETIYMIGNPEEIHNEKAQEDKGDITSKDVERLRQFLTPTVHTLPNLEPVVPPCIPLGLVHNKDKIIREKEYDYDIPLNDSVMQPLTPHTIHITQPDDDYVTLATNPMSNKQSNKFKEEFSYIIEVAEKEYDNPVIKTYDRKTFIQKLLHQVSQSSREMKFQQQHDSNLPFPCPVAIHDVHCYSHSHLISNEGRNTLLLGK